MSAEARDADASLVADTETGMATGPHARVRQAGGCCMRLLLQGDVHIHLLWEIANLVVSLHKWTKKVLLFSPKPFLFCFFHVTSVGHSGMGFIDTVKGMLMPENPFWKATVLRSASGWR